jgi:hypothetical protein
MRRNVSVEDSAFEVDYPDRCPICHHYGDIQQVSGAALPDGKSNVLFRCPYPECRQFFIGTFGPYPEREALGLVPARPEPASFAEELGELSPSFVEIYGQAEEARSLGLLQVAGPGYRKAFEFLIKDYAKSSNSEAAEEIEQAFSGNVVNDYIPDPRIQKMAKRALWLGNDETHYLRKWQSHDMDDLIALIKLAVHWIEIERLSAEYTEEMPDGV